MVLTLPRLDKPALIEKLLFIDNKEGKVIPFKPNYVQSFFLLNKARRNIILKARQLGLTSIILADMYTDCITIPNTDCAVVSHETRATQRLLDRVQFFHESMLSPKPILGAESRSEKTFPELYSSIFIGTAGSRAFGHGETLRKAHLSELAYYENGETVLNGVEDAVPLSGELTIESTPNGESNVFYEKWIRAKEGKSSYKPFFFPWWLEGGYRIPRESPLSLPEDKGELTYGGEEIELMEKHHLTEDQIRWRRWKISEKGGLFWQEYPEDEVSCFITIGDPVYDTMLLNNMAAGCYEGQKHPGGWTYWIPPDTTGKTHYVIGADTSAGAPDGSFSAACVLDDYWRVCATFQARIEPYLFANILKAMGTWYNRAEIAVERNFTGYAVLAALAGGTNIESAGVSINSYPNLYRQRDFLTGKVTNNIGWWTNVQTKEHMRTSLRDRLAQLKIWDVNLVRQLRSYRYIKMEATPQTFDDLAIALQIACAVRKVEGGSRGFQGSVPGYSGRKW